MADPVVIAGSFDVEVDSDGMIDDWPRACCVERNVCRCNNAIDVLSRRDRREILIQQVIHPPPGPEEEADNITILSRNIMSLNSNLISGLVGGADFVGLQQVALLRTKNMM